MAGNSFGAFFRVTTFGESHGAGVGCVIDGCPPLLALDAQAIQRDLDRRKPGQSKYVTQRKEPDEAEILSGVFEGKTTGAPIAILIRNRDARPRDYEKLRDIFRPGHADFAYQKKYGIRDYRGGGRSSARVTAAVVAAGAVARQWLAARFQIVARACLTQMGGIDIPFESWDEVDKNPFFAPNAAVVSRLEEKIESLRRDKDSCGARIRVVAENAPPGWGEPVFDRLDADLAKALMGINAVKAVSIGDGFESVRQRGSEHSDEMTKDGFASNHAGGILGGISTGQNITAEIGLKPTSSIAQERRTIDARGFEIKAATTGRHDPCVGLRAAPIAEAMTLLVLIDHALRQRAQCGD